MNEEKDQKPEGSEQDFSDCVAAALPSAWSR
jgi:hypothetical protein